MEEKINLIKRWLGTGSINIFGMPFSGKDTVGVRLAQDLNGRFLSSGLIMRAAEENDKDLLREMNQGLLASTDKFRDIVLPYFKIAELRDFPLILSSVGRWEGEEYDVIAAMVTGIPTDMKDKKVYIRSYITYDGGETYIYGEEKSASINDVLGE